MFIIINPVCAVLVNIIGCKLDLKIVCANKQVKDLHVNEENSARPHFVPSFSLINCSEYLPNLPRGLLQRNN